MRPKIGGSIFLLLKNIIYWKRIFLLSRFTVKKLFADKMIFLSAVKEFSLLFNWCMHGHIWSIRHIPRPCQLGPINGNELNAIVQWSVYNRTLLPNVTDSARCDRDAIVRHDLAAIAQLACDLAAMQCARGSSLLRRFRLLWMYLLCSHGMFLIYPVCVRLFTFFRVQQLFHRVITAIACRKM